MKRRLAAFAALGLAALGLAVVAPARAANPNALWRVVHDLCVTDMKATGLPAPCAKVDLAAGYVVLKDMRGATQYLVIPTARVAGIESPAVLAPDAPNYWQDAWDARRLIEKRVGHAVPREDVALAVNSVYGRSQNQLHIHIDCVKPQVKAVLAERLAAIGPDWTPLSPRLLGHRYRVRWLEGEDLGANDPFKLLAQGVPSAAADMAGETLVVIGARRSDGAPGFVLLSRHAVPAVGDGAAGEELMDHGCAVLGPDQG